MVDENHDIFIILDQEFNFSSQVGIPVNGIIGYHFFKNHLVEINYSKKKITVYENDKKIKSRIDKRFISENISLENNKPYYTSDITSEQSTYPSKLLLDSGNSDAIWIFSDKKATIPKDATGTLVSNNTKGKQWFWNGHNMIRDTTQRLKPVQSGP